MKFSQKEIFIFLAGAEAFHTLCHLYISMAVNLPIQLGSIILTRQTNTYAIIINAAATIGLLWWAKKEKQ
jgi:hypothetical protein